MDSRIFSDGQRPAVEWAARDTHVSARTSPVTSRLQTSMVVEDPQSEDVDPVARSPATPPPNLSWGEYLLTPETDHPPVTSPDPITPGDGILNSTVSQPNPPNPSSLLIPIKPAAQHSAPAEMGPPHHRLSGLEPLQSTGTWDEVKKQRLQATARLEDTLEEIGEATPPEHDQEVEVDEMLQEEERGSPQRPLPRSAYTAPQLAITTSLAETTPADPVPEQQTFVDRAPGPPGDTAPGGGAAAGGRGWGAPFKVQWIRTDPLSFHRTKQLKNPWNNDVCSPFLSTSLADLLFSAGDQGFSGWDGGRAHYWADAYRRMGEDRAPFWAQPGGGDCQDLYHTAPSVRGRSGTLRAECPRNWLGV